MTISVRSRFVRIDGRRTHYSEVGENGPAIVAVHGGGAGSSGEAGMGPLMGRLSEFRVVAPDSTGGFGKTDVDTPTSRGLQSRVDHLAQFVDALCLDRFTLMGNSQGAWVAAKYAMTFPERVERIILVGSGSIAGAMGVGGPITPSMMAMLNYDGTEDGMRRLISGLVYNQSLVSEDIVKMRTESANRPGAMEAFRAAQAGTRWLQSDPLMKEVAFDMRQSLPALTRAIPTAFLWGEDDSFALPENGREVQKLLPDADFHWIAEAGHQVQNDQPDQMADIVKKFMAVGAAQVKAG
ncbi:alpha/beta hydrolase [Sphingopyxis sp.]|uniref:alpha/beta fold hydrolase n=1 Tax=Sphingopyxis sp. TaxID=1908224 RepID=UPI002D782760|nr:alpha/beta hydrolase [Sphingopyxis sp.]HET6523086.1 alpha/beta hydrolase [Sphingopyxis sp.]